MDSAAQTPDGPEVQPLRPLAWQGVSACWVGAQPGLVVLSVPPAGLLALLSK